MMNTRINKVVVVLIAMGLWTCSDGAARAQTNEPERPGRGPVGEAQEQPHRPNAGPGTRGIQQPQQPPQPQRQPQRFWSTPEERAQIEDFAQQHMPNLYRMVQDAPERGMRRWRIFNHAAREYRRYQAEKSESPERGETMLQRIRQQDHLFALVREYRAAGTAEQAAIRERLREMMRQIVVQMLEEREQRIARLKEMLQREEQSFERDRDRIDEITAQRVETLLDETRPRMPGGGGGATPGITAPDEPRGDRPAPDRPR